MAKELIEDTGLNFRDISNEVKRTYLMVGSGGQLIDQHIHNPQWLAISASGGHRLMDGEGVCHYIPKASPSQCGYIAVSWTVRDGESHFRF